MNPLSKNRNQTLTISRRHASRQWMIRSSLARCFGSGFISYPVVIFLAATHDLKGGGFLIGFCIGLILALPNLFGVLRVFTPVMISKIGNRKLFCILAFFLEILSLGAMIYFGRPDFLSKTAALVCITAFWCLAKLAEYCGWVALSAWTGDIFPEKTRGRFFGIREFRRLSGEFFSVFICTILTIWWWSLASPYAGRVSDYYVYALMVMLGAFSFAVGTLMLLPVADIPNDKSGEQSSAENSPDRKAETVTARGIFRELAAPFRDPGFRIFLFYCAFFSFVTQLEQVFQTLYPAKFFAGITPLLMVLWFRLVVRGGQILFCEWAGKKVDRYGAMPIMVIAQFLTALGPLFYFFANLDTWWLLFGAHFCFIAYVGLNVGLPQAQLQFSPPGKGAVWIACYGAVGGFLGFCGALLSGYLYTTFFADADFSVPILPGHPILKYVYLIQIPFLISFIFRITAGFLLMRVKPRRPETV